ncbi:MAG: hypothetical protein ABI599_09045 [Flavobacteriales bacterium]
MSKHYRIQPQALAPTDAEISRYRDFGKLVYNYEQMTKPLYKRPLYKDPKAFIAIIIIVLLAVILAEVVEKGKAPPVKGPTEQKDP